LGSSETVLPQSLEFGSGAHGTSTVADCPDVSCEKQARSLASPERLQLRQIQSRPILDKLRNYLLEIEPEVLPKSPEGRAVRYTLKNWTALTRFCEDGDLEIDNNGTEGSIRDVAVGQNNWIFFGSDHGGSTARLFHRLVRYYRPHHRMNPAIVLGTASLG
jgi:hypothetical protein